MCCSITIIYSVSEKHTEFSATLVHTNAHWFRGGQQVVLQNFKAKSTTKRFGQIFKQKLDWKFCGSGVYEP